MEKDGRSYLVRYSWLELLNAWAVVYEDQADLLQPVYQMGASVLAVMLLGMCVIWVLVQYVCQSMLKRLALLEKKMLAVQSGNLDIRIPERENGGMNWIRSAKALTVCWTECSSWWMRIFSVDLR